MAQKTNAFKMAKYHYIMLALMGFLEPWPLQAGCQRVVLNEILAMFRLFLALVQLPATSSLWILPQTHSQVLVRWRQVQQHCLRSIDLELCRVCPDRASPVVW